MRMPIVGCMLGACVFAAFTCASSAQIITQWTFNSVVADASTSTGSSLPSVGNGTASAIGDVNAGFAAGSPRDDAVSDNTAWSLSHWPAQGGDSGMAGAQFLVSTAGIFDRIEISFDFRQSLTASERLQLQATSDGVSFSNVSGGTASFGTTGNNTGTSFDTDGLLINTAASSSQAFVQSVTYTFTAGSEFEDNANFGFRIVSVFDGAQYDAAGASSNYGTSGTVRLDMVTVSSASGAVAVPEPATSGLAMGAFALAVVLTRRRRNLRAAASAESERRGERGDCEEGAE